jgi:hypothetical protein
MLGRDRLPIRQQDWPPPQRVTWYRDWELSLLQSTLTPAAALPFNQDDWQLPRTPQPINQTWTWNQVPMLGRDLLPFNQNDWPTPRRIIWYRDWSANLLETTLAVTQAPVRQQDWPLSIPLPRQAVTVTWSFNFALTFVAPVVRPFNQYNWPLPQVPKPIDQAFWSSGLLQSTLTPAAVSMPVRVVWPAPPRPVWYRDWSVNLLQSTLAAPPVVRPFNQYDWPLPRAPKRIDETWTSWNIYAPSFMPGPAETGVFAPPPPQAITWTANLLQSTLAPAVAKPFAQFDWPLPKSPRPIEQTWNWNQVAMLGRDKLPVRQQDWPLPATARPNPTEQVQNLLLTAFTLAAVPFKQTDWPLPAPLPPHSKLRSWTWNQAPMLGRDALPVRQQDWPLPRTARPIEQTSAFNQVPMLGRDRLPIRQQDWPLPATARPNPTEQVQNLLLTAFAAAAAPFRQADWPLPRLSIPITPTWAWNQTPLLGQDQLPVRQQDWPNPPRPARAVTTEQVQSLLLTALTAAVPFKQTDWPLPAPLPPHSKLRSWTWNQAPMLGRDQFPIRQQDWPAPPRVIWYRDWRLNLRQSTLTPPPVTRLFAQFDWPLPAPRPREAITWTWNETVMLTAAAAPFVRTDRGQRTIPITGDGERRVSDPSRRPSAGPWRRVPT